MNYRILIFGLISIFAFSCQSDPCEEEFNIECETGDVDEDGILNLEDIAPNDPCIPEENNLECPEGDFDEDGTVNSLDTLPEDPCFPVDNLMCPTGDLDEDGIINVDDVAPLDFCTPIRPPLSEIIIGSWRWHISNHLGTIKFNSDGTYEDIDNEFLPTNEGSEKIWVAMGDDTIEIRNRNGDSEITIFYLETISLRCHVIVFGGFSIGDFIFIKL